MSKRFVPRTSSTSHGVQLLRSGDGELTFALQVTGGGLFVERVVQRPQKGRVVQAAEFKNLAGFRRWCDSDAVKFQYPLVHHRLLQLGDEMLRSHEPSEVPG
jgi:hypothetical protein